MTSRMAKGEGRGAHYFFDSLFSAYCPPSPFPLVAARRFSVLALFIFLSITSTVARAQPTALEREAQAAWDQRDKPGQTELAIELWTKAANAEPTRGDLWAHLAKAMGRAVRHAKDSDERRAWADRAKTTAEEALKISPTSSESYTVYGEALGQWANAHKGLQSLKVVRQAVEALEKAVAIDPQNAYAHMLLAEFYRQSPRFFSIGDKRKALKHALLAVQFGPHYAIDHLVLARAYLDLGQKAECIAELQSILGMSAPADAVPETQADQETAAALLKSLGVTPNPKPSGSSESVPPGCGEAGGYCSEGAP